MFTISLIQAARKSDSISELVGIRHSKLRELIGDPSGWGIDQRRDNAKIWKYGDIEFHFDNFYVNLICSDHNHLVKGAGYLEIDPWIIRRGLHRRDFESALDTESIAHTSKLHPFDESQQIVTTEGGATFTFVEDSDGYSLGLDSWAIAAEQIRS